MQAAMRIVYKLWHYSTKGIYKYLAMPFKLAMLKKCGRNVYIARGTYMDYQNVTLGDDVSVGPFCLFLCSRAEIWIGNHVMFGPHVFMITGNHRLDIVGRYMTNISDDEKLPENDQPIILEGDNWIGANTIILSGITLGRGSVVSAGSVVTHDVEPYSIYAGVPAKKIRDRFNEADLRQHLMLIGDEG